MPLLQLGPRRSVDAETIVGNVYLGDLTIQQFAGHPPSEPELPWLTDIDADTRDVDLLRWHARLTPIVGRGEEMEETLAWATGAGAVKARFVTGAGGIGKSRFAAEVAERLREQGWKAGFIDLRRDVVLPVSEVGLLLIIDYPEENRNAVRRLLDDLGRLHPGNGQRIRALLLSRRGEGVWADDVAQSDASSLFSRTKVPSLREIQSVADAFDLFTAAVRRLAKLRGVEAASVELSAFETWFTRNDLHRLPLFLTAAAVQTVNAPETPILSLSGREVIEALVMRERRRAAKEGTDAGLSENALPRLYALAAIRDGLDASTLRRLADPALYLGLGRVEDLTDRLARTGRLEKGTLPKLQPDIVAAAFLVQELARSSQDAPDWLWAAMKDQEAESIDRAARIAHDAEVVLGIHDHRLTAWLTTMLDGRPDRCASLDGWASDRDRGFAMPAVAGVVAMTLASVAGNDTEKARCLMNGSTCLWMAGNREGTLFAIQEAVNHYRKLADADPGHFLPDLAKSFNNLSSRLSEAGDRTGALAAIREAVGHFRTLAVSAPERFFPDLATSLNNLSLHLSEAGDRAGALAAIREAVGHFQTLAQSASGRFLPDLAMSLHNLSKILSEAGDGAGALVAIREAVSIRRKLAQSAPWRFLPDLAMSLSSLSVHLLEASDGAEALAAIREAVSIRRKLADADPGRFLPDLANSLNNLSNRLSESGDVPGALAAIREAVGHFQTLAQSTSGRFLPDLAMSLHTLSNRLSEAGDGVGALAAIREAVSIRRTLAESASERYLADLASSLNNLSTELSETGDGAGALAAIQEAVGHFRTLAESAPGRYLPDLAKSLNTLSNILSEAGDGAGALAAIREAMDHHRTLVKFAPGRFLPDLADSLNNLSRRFSEAGDGAGALAAIREAVDHYRTLVEFAPGRFLPDLAMSLSNLSTELSETGDGAGALAAIREAVTIRRGLAQSEPQRYAHLLANSLSIMAGLIAVSGTPEEAISILGEAIHLIELLAQNNPKALPARWHRRMLADMAKFQRMVTDGEARPWGD